jgi:hypothetical protein
VPSRPAASSLTASRTSCCRTVSTRNPSRRADASSRSSEEVVAVRLQLVDLQAAVLAELAGDGLLTAARAYAALGALSGVVALVADVLQCQDGTAADVQRLGFDEADDAGVGAQASHGLGLAGEDLAAAVGEGDLQHGQRAGPAGFGLQVADEEGAAGGAGAEAAADLPPVGEHVTGDGLQGVLVGGGLVVLVARPLRAGGRLGGGGEGVLDDLQQLQELVHAGQPLAGAVGGGGLHQVVDVLREAVHQGAGAQSLARLQSGQQLGLAGGRGLAGDQQVGEDAEPVHVEVDRVGVEGGEFGGEVGVGVVGQVHRPQMSVLSRWPHKSR